MPASYDSVVSRVGSAGAAMIQMAAARESGSKPFTLTCRVWHRWKVWGGIPLPAMFLCSVVAPAHCPALAHDATGSWAAPPTLQRASRPMSAGCFTGWGKTRPTAVYRARVASHSDALRRRGSATARRHYAAAGPRQECSLCPCAYRDQSTTRRFGGSCASAAPAATPCHRRRKRPRSTELNTFGSVILAQI